MKQKIKITAFLLLIASMFAPMYIFAETLGSAHYQIRNPDFSSGGSSSGSANFNSYDAVDDSANAKTNSANYNLFPGLILPLFPNIPGIPTFMNSTGVEYNTLDFIVAIDANSSDTNYAVAISKDNFVTTLFVQADDNIGTSPVWQTYSAWGGAIGQRIIGLEPSTTYKLKVKARYGRDSETAYSGIATASTVAPNLTLTISGVSTGTNIAGATTNVTTGSGSVAFGSIQVGSIKIGAQTATITTNANGGYSLTVQEDHDLQRTDGVTMPNVSGTNASPVAWPAGVTTGAFGYHTDKSPLCTGTTTRFSTANTFAALATSPAEISCSTGPVVSDVADILYKLEVENRQPAGDYNNKIEYITTASF